MVVSVLMKAPPSLSVESQVSEPGQCPKGQYGQHLVEGMEDERILRNTHDALASGLEHWPRRQQRRGSKTSCALLLRVANYRGNYKLRSERERWRPGLRTRTRRKSKEKDESKRRRKRRRERRGGRGKRGEKIARPKVMGAIRRGASNGINPTQSVHSGCLIGSPLIGPSQLLPSKRRSCHAASPERVLFVTERLWVAPRWLVRMSALGGGGPLQ